MKERGWRRRRERVEKEATDFLRKVGERERGERQEDVAEKEGEGEGKWRDRDWESWSSRVHREINSGGQE